MTNEDLEERKLKNNKALCNYIKTIRPSEFNNLYDFGLIDELFNLRREKFIKLKRKQYLKDLREKRIKNPAW